jgi:hypothetical protein
MTADLGTRCCELYAPADEVLPLGDGARNLEPAGPPGQVDPDPFARSRERFEGVVAWLGGDQADGLEHSGT